MGSEAGASAPSAARPGFSLEERTPSSAMTGPPGLCRAFSFSARGPPDSRRPAPRRSPGGRSLAPHPTLAHNRVPMRELRLGLAQLNPTVGDLDGNFKKVVSAI